jgi:hypothetical protein
MWTFDPSVIHLMNLLITTRRALLPAVFFATAALAAAQEAKKDPAPAKDADLLLLQRQKLAHHGPL